MSKGMKTTMMKLIAETQASGGVCAVIDMSGKLDTDYLVGLGVKLDDLLVSQPESLEQASEIVDTLVRTGAIDLIIADCGLLAVPSLRTTPRNSTAVMLIPGVWS